MYSEVSVLHRSQSRDVSLCLDVVPTLKVQVPSHSPIMDSGLRSGLQVQIVTTVRCLGGQNPKVFRVLERVKDDCD